MPWKAASRETSIHPLVTHHYSLCRAAPFVIEQPFLAPPSAAVTAQRAIRPDNAVARDYDANHVRAVCATNCAARIFISQALRHPRIRASFPHRDGPKDFPGTQLKVRSDRRQRNIKLQIFAGKIITELLARRCEVRMLTRHDVGSQSLAQDRQFTFGRASVDKLEQTQPFIVRDSDHRAQRRIDSLHEHRRPRSGSCGWFTKNLCECFAKTAFRFKTAAVSRSIHATAPAKFAQSKTHPARAMISLKCHSIMPFELPTRRGWIDCHGRQFLVRYASVRRALNFSAQSLDQFGRTFVWIHRMATQTRTITFVQRLTGRRKKIDIFSRRLFRRARWPAKNSRRAHPDQKYAFETRIALQQGAIHRFRWRKKLRRFHARWIRSV